MYRHCPSVVVLIGFLFVISGYTISWYLLPSVQEKFAMSTNLIENTSFFYTWQRTPFPLKFKVYFFHVLNPEEVQNGAQPKLMEKGPYVYDDYHEKTNVKVNDEEDTVEYFNKRIFVFNQKESGCRTDEDEITVLNPSVMGTALQIEQMMPAALSLINDALPHLFPGIKDAFLRTKVKDILFDGVRISCKDPAVSMVCNGIRSKRPPSMRDIPGEPDLLFSTLNQFNGTEDGPYVVGRGLKNTTKGSILKYKGDDHVSVWAGETCNKISGADNIIPALPLPVPSLYFFAMELCRSIRLDFERPSMTGGLVTFRYSAPPDMYHSTKPNECFCPLVMNDEDEDVPKCLKAGLFDLSPCLKAVLYVSSPHFLYGDPELLKYPITLNPDKGKHETFMEIEPSTGVSISGAMRIQFNLQAKKMEDIVYLQNISEGVFPIMWTESSTQLPEPFIQNIKRAHNMMSLLYILKYVLISIGMVVMVSSLAVVAYSEKLYCFSKCGKVSTTEFTRNNNQVESNVATINVGNLNTSMQRMVDDIGNVRRKNAHNALEFQN